MNTANTVDQLVVTRVFDAPPALVYRAFVDPDQLARWFGPVGFHVEDIDSDVRVGAHQRMVMTADDGSMRSQMDTTFTEVIENKLLVGTQVVPEGVPVPSGMTHMPLRLEFHEEEGGRTRLVVHQGPYTPDFENMARMGWEGSFTKLDALLAA